VEVILLQDVEKVGLRGEVVNVSRGYMRNFLEPRRLAEPATAARVAELEKREAIRARHEAKSFEQAQEMAETLRRTELRFEVKAGPRGRLFGAVTPTDITDELWRARKIRVDRRKIDIADPIKRVGRYDVSIELFADVETEVKLLVVPEGGELPPDEEIAGWEAEEAAEQEAEEAAAAEEHAVAEEAVEEAYAEQATAAGVGEQGATEPPAEPAVEAAAESPAEGEPPAPEAQASADEAEPAPVETRERPTPE
jgi:large subunit ribosomal protein L9